jgi:hypothetical protein
VTYLVAGDVSYKQQNLIDDKVDGVTYSVETSLASQRAIKAFARMEPSLRAGILPRWPAGLLAVAATMTPAAALLPHDIQRLAAVPVGLAVAWLGYELWSERRELAAEPVPGPGSPKLHRTAAQ